MLASEEKTKELGKEHIWITGIGAGSNQYYGNWADLMDLKGLRTACRHAYRMAGVTRPESEIDAAEIFAPFAPFEFLALDALGIFALPQSLQMVRDGMTHIHGPKPVNPSGGTVGTNPPSCGGIFRTIQAAQYLQHNPNAHRVAVQDSDINLGFFGETYHVAIIERGGID